MPKLFQQWVTRKKTQTSSKNISFDLMRLLPNDVLFLICAYTQYMTFIRLGEINTRFYQITHQHPFSAHFWINQINIYYPFAENAINAQSRHNTLFYKNRFIQLYKNSKLKRKQKELFPLIYEGNITKLESKTLSLKDWSDTQNGFSLIAFGALNNQSVLDHFFNYYKDQNKNDILSLAITFNQITIVKELLQKKENLEILKETSAFLNFTVMHGFKNMARLLIENGVSVDDDGKYAPVYAACAYNQLSILKMLVDEHNANLKLLYKPNSIYIDAHFNAGVVFTMSVLEYACNHGRLEIVKWLVNEKKITDRKSSKNNAYTPALESAAQNGHLAIVKFLLPKLDYPNENIQDAISAVKNRDKNKRFHSSGIQYLLLKAQLIQYIHSKMKATKGTSGIFQEDNTLSAAKYLLTCLNENHSIEKLAKQYPCLKKDKILSPIYNQLRQLDLKKALEQLKEISAEETTTLQFKRS